MSVRIHPTDRQDAGHLARPLIALLKRILGKIRMRIDIGPECAECERLCRLGAQRGFHPQAIDQQIEARALATSLEHKPAIARLNNARTVFNPNAGFERRIEQHLKQRRAVHAKPGRRIRP